MDKTLPSIAKGELPNKKFYIVSDTASTQHGSGAITVLSPTEHAVEQAKIAVKRKLELLPVGGRRSSKKTKLGLKKTINRAYKKKKHQSKSKS